MSTEWKWVPVEPTDKMLSAVWTLHQSRPWPEAGRAAYAAMLAASPQPAQAEPGAVTSNVAQPEPCIGHNPACPCQDGDLCHYKDAPDGSTKGWPVPQQPGPGVLTEARIIKRAVDSVRLFDRTGKEQEFGSDEWIVATLEAAGLNLAFRNYEQDNQCARAILAAIRQRTAEENKRIMEAMDACHNEKTRTGWRTAREYVERLLGGEA